MTTLLVSYDLRKPNQNYKGLLDELQKSQAWWHYLDSTWLIKTSENATQLYNRLIHALDRNDSILIIEVKRHYQGWLPKEAWDWINQNVT